MTFTNGFQVVLIGGGVLAATDRRYRATSRDRARMDVPATAAS